MTDEFITLISNVVIGFLPFIIFFITIAMIPIAIIITILVIIHKNNKKD